MRGNPNKIKPYRWKPGQSGNPGGRPKKRPISDAYELLSLEPLPERIRLALKLKKGATYADAIAIVQIRQALNGNTQAAREIREGIEGKAKARIELTGKDGGPLEGDIRAMSDKELDAHLIRTLKEEFGSSEEEAAQAIALLTRRRDK